MVHDFAIQNVRGLVPILSHPKFTTYIVTALLKLQPCYYWCLFTCKNACLSYTWVINLTRLLTVRSLVMSIDVLLKNVHIQFELGVDSGG